VSGRLGPRLKREFKRDAIPTSVFRSILNQLSGYNDGTTVHSDCAQLRIKYRIYVNRRIPSLPPSKARCSRMLRAYAGFNVVAS
jgi:hypothetical protein